ncbi:gamma carbonic anhydrase family protein [bacterium]|nr:gamma carbonic anhydrase family protein [bacterium]
MIINYLDKIPTIDERAYIFKNATVIGDVTLEAECNIWFGAVVRGDVNSIFIGARTNIQDNVTIHVTTALYPTSIGRGVTVGHNAVIHGSTVGDNSLIGMGAVILDGCKIGKNSIVAANSLLRGGTEVPDGVLFAGNPAKLKRELTEEEIAGLKKSADNYVRYAGNYLTTAAESIYSDVFIKEILNNLRTNIGGIK